MTWSSEQISDSCPNCAKKNMQRDSRSAGELTQWKDKCNNCGYLLFIQFEGDDITKRDVWNKGRQSP